MAKQYNDVTIKCANCGTEFTFGSTSDKFGIEICSQCHPFYTGKSSLVDTSGRLEKFNARVQKVADSAKKEKKVKSRKPRLSITDIEQSK